MMLRYGRLVDDDQAARLRIFVSRASVSSRAEAAEVEGSTRSDFLTPSKALFPVILRVPRVESRLFPTLLHSSLKSCHCRFIDSINATFCRWKNRTGILREARVE